MAHEIEGAWHVRLIRRAGGFFSAFAIVYIAVIGVFAVEELERREKTLSMLTARENEVAAALAALPDGTATTRRAELENELSKLRGLRARLTVLIIGDAIRPKGGTEGTLKELLCEWEALRNPDVVCPIAPADEWSGREIAAKVVLKRTCEQRSSGDIFAVLVLVAACGGALVRLYLPGNEEEHRTRTVLRALGGGIVCYLALSGGTVPLSGVTGPIKLTASTSPATGALLGFLAGMFSTKVFELVSYLVDTWVGKLAPTLTAPQQAKAHGAAPSQENVQTNGAPTAGVDALPLGPSMRVSTLPSQPPGERPRSTPPAAGEKKAKPDDPSRPPPSA